jgi:hypothetical protein
MTKGFINRPVFPEVHIPEIKMFYRVSNPIIVLVNILFQYLPKIKI